MRERKHAPARRAACAWRPVPARLFPGDDWGSIGGGAEIDLAGDLGFPVHVNIFSLPP
jgi:hypothetical protein